jgi:hypothetical protein
MSRSNNIIASRLFTLPIDDHYNSKEGINNDISFLSIDRLHNDLSNLIIEDELKPYNKDSGKYLKSGSTNSSSPYCNDMISNIFLSNYKTMFIQEPVIYQKRRKVKILKCVSKNWKSKCNNLRDILAKRLVEKVFLMNRNSYSGFQRINEGNYCKNSSHLNLFFCMFFNNRYNLCKFEHYD